MVLVSKFVKLVPLISQKQHHFIYFFFNFKYERERGRGREESFLANPKFQSNKFIFLGDEKVWLDGCDDELGGLIVS